MALCDNAFCTEEIEESAHIALASRKFCCTACADDWRRQNEALIEAAAPFHLPAQANNVIGARADLSGGLRRK